MVPDALELIQDATGGGPHAVIDFVGMPPTSALGRSALRKGGTQVQVGLFGGPMEIDVGQFATARKYTSNHSWTKQAQWLDQSSAGLCFERLLVITDKHLMGNFVGSLDEFKELMVYVRNGQKKDIPCKDTAVCFSL